MKMRSLRWLFIWCLSLLGAARAQLSPFRQMQLANLLQQRNSMLQQTLLENLLNQAAMQSSVSGTGTMQSSVSGTGAMQSSVSGTGATQSSVSGNGASQTPGTAVSQTPGTGGSQGVPLVRQLAANVNRMTQTMMDNIRSGNLPVAGTLDGDTFLPIDVILRQQRNLQSQLLRNVQNRPATQGTIQTFQNRGFPQQTNTGGARANNVLASRNESIPQSSLSGARTTEPNPFLSSISNTSFQDIFSTFGSFGFPRTPASSLASGTSGSGGTSGMISRQTTGFPAGEFQSLGGGITDLSTQTQPQTAPTSQQTTFDPATGITFGTGFVQESQTSENIGGAAFNSASFNPQVTDSTGQFNFGGNFNTGSSNVNNIGNIFNSDAQAIGGQSGTPFGGRFTTEQQMTSDSTGTTFNQGFPTFQQSSAGGTTFDQTSLVGTTFGQGSAARTTSDPAGATFPGGFTAQRSLTSTGATGGFQTTSTSGRQGIIPDALTCTEEYRKISGHTLCMTDSSGVRRAGVNADDRLRILQIHNTMRANVQPPAADLVMLQWDDRLAAVAQKWAKQCRLAHDTERTIPEMGMSVGQNVAVGFETWPDAIQMWYDEISLYRYGFEPDMYLGLEGWRRIAHFTQIVQNGTYMLGCGYAECPDTEYVRYYVCNYAAGQTDLAYPYTAGSRCEMCPNNCNSGLCDCGGLVCINGGRLDPRTCKCECPKPYSGDTCEIVDCPVRDNWICGRDWPPSYCDQFYNVPEECPYMCGICGDGTGFVPEVVTPNVTIFTSAFGCRYNGIRDDEATCRTYGENGSDMRMCASEGGTVGCGECDRYFNIKKDYCPVMCGICDPPCGGKRCSNGGTLDTVTCSCTCRKPFTGDTCEFAQCPINGDPGFCRFWPPRYCQMYYNVPEECPYMCGICKMDNISVSVRGRPNFAEGTRQSGREN